MYGCLDATAAESDKIDKPHGDDESDCSEDANRRKVFDGVESVVFENREGHRVRKCDCRHVEGDTQAVGDEDWADRGHLAGDRLQGGLVAEPCSYQHEQTCGQMRYAEQTLGLDKFIGNGTDDGGHKDRYDSLCHIEP